MSDGIQTQINISEAKIATATVTIQHLMVKDRNLIVGGHHDQGCS
jgi:hypothetical protein